MTSILALPEIETPVFIETGEDWIDALAFVDASSSPVPLDGIGFHLQIRLSASDNEIYLEGSTDDGSLQILASAAIPLAVSGGAGYAAGDLIHAPAADAIVPFTIEVMAIGAGGSIAAVAMSDPGIYAALPSNPVTQGSTSGAGSGAMFSLTWVNNAVGIIIPAADLPEKFVSGSYVYAIQASAEGYTLTLASGALTLTDGIVR